MLDSTHRVVHDLNPRTKLLVRRPTRSAQRLTWNVWREYGQRMGLTFFMFVFDVDDPQRVGRFWAAALERELSEGEPGSWATLPGDPRLDFMKVPEGKITKNRVHLVLVRAGP